MRKQTKVVAVASAAALLAIGGAMTSFAAQGWVEEDGTWYYYDKDGNRVESEWRKSGDGWYYLDSDENGAMATDKLIDDDDDTYYVDANGAMVKNTWVKVVNEDQDDDDDPAEYHYYYMQSNGKAIKAPSSGKTTFKTIDGKRYAFDDDGIMLWGWVNDNSERETDDNGWADATYYLGSWEDGAMKTGWQKITVYDDTTDKDDDYDYWLNFKSNGKKRTNNDSNDSEQPAKTWKSGNKRYHFDQRGVMVYEWYNVATGSEVASAVTSWRYFNSPEDGARMTKGWFKVVAPSQDSDNSFLNYADGDSFAYGDSNDEEERWYYADKDGVLQSSIIKKINGKYYGFYPEQLNSAGDTTQGGRALAGLNQIDVDGNGAITRVYDDGVDADELDDLLDNGISSSSVSGDLYFFGNKGDIDTDAVMKTGNVTINLDGESYNFYFQKTGTPATGKGKGVTGIDDNKYVYIKGMRIKAGADDKYQMVDVTEATTGAGIDINSDNAVVTKLDAPTGTADVTYTNKDGETVRVYVINDASKYLVNTSGNLQKSKTSGVKDGNDCYYYVNSDRHVIFYTDNKVLKTDNTKYPTSITVNGNGMDDLAAALGITVVQ